MATSSDQEIDLLELALLFYRKKVLILFITFLGAIIGIAIALFSTPIYRADALIQLEEKSSGGMALSSDLSSLFADTPQSVAEIEILRSRMILGQVINSLRLDISATPKRLPIIGNFLSRYEFSEPNISFISTYAWHNETIELGFLEVPDVLLDQTITLTYLGDGAFEIDLDAGAPIVGQVGQPLRRSELDFAILVNVITGQPGREYELKKSGFANVLTEIRSNYTINEKGKNSSIIQLMVQGPNPALATQILKKITDVYLLQNVNRNAAEADSSLTFIQAQLPETEATMRAAESAVNAYKLSQDSVDLSFETLALLEQAVAIAAQLSQIDLEEQELKKRYTPAHPVYQTLLGNRGELENQLEKVRLQSMELPETQLEMLRLTQNLEVAREIYLQLVSRAQELAVIKAGTIGNIRVIDTPMSFPKPIKPSKPLVVIISTVLALFLAVVLVLLRSFMTKGVEGQEQIEALGLSVFGAIQKVGNGDFTANKRGRDTPILAKTDPTNLSVEALRSLRTSLHFGMLDAKSSLLLFTSSRPGEGKSFLAVNLATVMAQAGQNVCLVDADIRRGYLRRFFGVPKSALGLTDVLAGDAELDDVIIKDPDTGLSFIPAGKYPPNPSELLMHKNFATTCAALDARFEMTLMDAPPLLAVTDPVIIGKYAGMILLVVRHLFTQVGELNAALKTLENNGLKANGAVLNAYSPKASNKGAGDYSYQYAYKTRD
ncbi:MAG: polysaccharide biosynthesis tyrosine autokinase [Rhodobacteraceae bacterium]|nr:polysaccharide biosynthesis tyrosine autokinase [Paracoccaceae bacterium]